ncbi:nucleoside triphosphate pyrophosphatase [Corynebacterium sputi]|uniref:nucleoside triphosphate pyrophosphatase n=1 Tax=Corynebacterium sputi TaxID=489915 RepID=UPI0003F88914|nr:nucleoside triphosphate pyrophosphatase [Corynebacterium sputi]
MNRFVLASSSPSRLSVLRSAGIEPEIIPPDTDEDAIIDRLGDAAPAEVVAALAEAKAGDVVVPVSEDLAVVVACDSMLLLDGSLSGKPHTVDECIRRWEKQRGREARLITGHAVRVVEGGVVKHEVTETISTTVHFGMPSDADIHAYAETGEPLGCAGAFTLEALGGWFIDGIDGDPSSVLGLSLPLIRRTLSDWGLDVSSFWNRTQK